MRGLSSHTGAPGWGNRFAYVLFFQDPGRAEAHFSSDLPAALRRICDGVAADPSFLSREAFRKGDLSGPLNYCRNIDRNWETTKRLADRVVECPCLLVMTDRDPILRPEFAEGTERWVPRLRRKFVKDRGHRTQQEKPDEVNRLLEFLANLSG